MNSVQRDASLLPSVKSHFLSEGVWDLGNQLLCGSALLADWQLRVCCISFCRYWSSSSVMSSVLTPTSRLSVNGLGGLHSTLLCESTLWPWNGCALLHLHIFCPGWKCFRNLSYGGALKHVPLGEFAPCWTAGDGIWWNCGSPVAVLCPCINWSGLKCLCLQSPLKIIAFFIKDRATM